MAEAKETEPLLVDIRDTPEPKKRSQWAPITGGVLLLALGAGAVAYLNSTSSSSSSQVAPAADLKQGLTVPVIDETDADIVPDGSHSYTFYSEYYPEGSQPGNGLYPFGYIAEIHRDTKISLSMNFKDNEQVKFFSWYINDEFQSHTTMAELSHKFTQTGYHELKVELYGPEDKVPVRTLKDKVMVRYVKRELRDMTEEDRKAFLDALETVYRVRTEEGKKLYGDGYQGIESLVNKHLYGAGQRDCDHWHDDAGIMTHHLAFTIEMEMILQTINPTVTIPYWEYTLDAAIYDADWADSKVFQDDWFGAASPDNKDHAVVDGRFGKIPVYQDYNETFSVFSNPYGQLRSPWNMNNGPWAITRYSKVTGMSYETSFPDCNKFSECFESDTLGEMNFCLGGNTHGPVHIMLGGQWGIDLGSLGKSTISTGQLLYFKNLWRRGFASCPASCDDDEDCSCSCNEKIVEKVGGAYEVLTTHTHIAKYLGGDIIRYDESTGKFYFAGKEEEIAAEDSLWEELLNLMCDPGSVGEMYTSSAPWDPLFWVIHTTAERLLQYKRLLAYYEIEKFEQTWGYENAAVPSDIGVVCDWSKVTDEWGLPDCIKETCTGHYAEDILPWNFESLSPGLKTITNVELYHFIGPISEDVPYVYDSFEWGHCSSDYTKMSFVDPNEVYQKLVDRGIKA